MVGAVYLDLLCEYHHARSWLDAEHFGIGIYPGSAVGAFGRFFRWLWRRRWVLQRRWRRLWRWRRCPLGFAYLWLSACGSGWSGAKGGCCSLRLKAGCMLGMPDCGQVALGDLSPITAIAPPMGTVGRLPIGYSAAGSRIAPRSSQCRAIAPCGERLGYNGHL